MLKNIVVGVSGGVESAVTSLLLKHKGFNVKAVFIKCLDIPDEAQQCVMNKKYESAEWICHKLKIPLVQADFIEEYQNDVVRFPIYLLLS